MTKKNWNIKIIGSILLFLFIFSSFSLFSFPQANNTLSKGESVKNSEELKLSATDWTTTMVVSTESDSSSLSPTIAVDSIGNAHVVWHDYSTNYINTGADWDIFYKLWNASTSTWNPTEVVSIQSTSDSEAATIAVDNDGNVHVAWHDATNYDGSGTDYDIFYKRWNLISSTWNPTEVVSTESSGDSFFPTIAVDNVGNAHVAWHDATNYTGSGIDQDIFYKLWNATSYTWTNTEVVSIASTGDSIHPSIAVDDVRNVHVGWDDATNYDGSGIDLDIFYKRWNVTSSTWTTTKVVSTESAGNSTHTTIAVNGTFYPTIMLPATGNVYVAWRDLTISYDGSGSDTDIFYKLWDATSNTWTNTEVVSIESSGDSLYPTIAVDSFMNVHIAWHDFTDYDGSGTDTDIFYKLWNATTSTWDPTETVSTQSTMNSFRPSIAVEGAGNAHVVWYDRTPYGGSEDDQDIFYKQSNPLLSGPGAPGIPGYNIFLLIGIICVVSVILFKKRNKIKL